MVNYACAFSQSESGKCFEWITRRIICLWTRIIQRITRLRRKIMWIRPLKILTVKLHKIPSNFISLLYYKNLLTLVKRLSVWFDHIMMSLIWCFDNFRWSKYPITESLKKEEKFIILFHLDSHRFLATSISWKSTTS